jgi:hypothetical protein
LIYRHWNRLTRKYTVTWDNFQGFYLTLETGNFRTWRDLYLRSQGEGDTRRAKGFVRVDGWSGTIHVGRFDAYDRAYTWGLYRWPQKWDIEIMLDEAEDTATGKLTLRQISRDNQSNWIIGGFAMTVVKGEFRLKGNVMSVFGFVESLINGLLLESTFWERKQ